MSALCGAIAITHHAAWRRRRSDMSGVTWLAGARPLEYEGLGVSSTFILSIVSSAIFKASAERCTRPLSAALSASSSSNVMNVTLTVTQGLHNGSCPVNDKPLVYAQREAATCAAVVASRSLRAASTTVPR
jgi:hypothetical protein